MPWNLGKENGSRFGEESNAIRGVRTKKIIGVSNFLKRTDCV